MEKTNPAICKCGAETRGKGQRDCLACHRQAESRRRKAKRPSLRTRNRLRTLRGILSRIKTKNSVRNRALLREAHAVLDTLAVPKWKHEDLP